MRVLHCLTYYLPHRTGLTLHVQRLAQGLAARGHAVTVLSARFRSDLPRTETIAGVRVLRLPAPVRISRGMVMPSYPAALWRLAGEHDVVHVHSPMLETPLAALACSLRRTALVITHHGDLVLPRGAVNRAIEGSMRVLWRLSAGRAGRLIAYSLDYARHSRALRRYPELTAAVLPPIDMPAPDPDRIGALRARLGVGEAPLVGFAGRFVEEKRPDLLLAAMPAVRQALPDAVAVFAGQVDLPYERYADRCRAQIDAQRGHLRFAGLLDDPADLAAFYALCSVLVLPSQSECFGLVQPEAMMCGTPVVATDIPGARVPVRATGMGRLAPPHDPDGLAEAIVDVISRRDRYVRPRAEITEIFSVARSVGAVEAVYREVLDR